MALLLSTSLKAVGVAALLPLAYEPVLAAAAAMVLPGAAAELSCAAEAAVAISALSGAPFAEAESSSRRKIFRLPASPAVPHLLFGSQWTIPSPASPPRSPAICSYHVRLLSPMSPKHL